MSVIKFAAKVAVLFDYRKLLPVTHPYYTFLWFWRNWRAFIIRLKVAMVSFLSPTKRLSTEFAEILGEVC